MNIDNYIEKKICRVYQGKKVIITGGASGIGLEASKIFLEKGAILYLGVRNLDKAKKSMTDLIQKYGEDQIHFLFLDLASFSSIQSFMDSLKKDNVDVDILINNAGVYNLPRTLTKDGLEIILGTNYFGTAYLNCLFFDYAKTLPHPVEVILTSSVAANLGKINYNDFYFEKHYDRMKVYGTSKLLLIHYFLTILKEANDSKVSYYLTHPGASYTPLIEKAYPKFFLFFAKPFMKLVFHTPKKACLPYFLALETQKVGSYSYPRGFLHLSGYPKQGKVASRFKKGIEQSQHYGLEQIKPILKNND